MPGVLADRHTSGSTRDLILAAALTGLATAASHAALLALPARGQWPARGDRLLRIGVFGAAMADFVVCLRLLKPPLHGDISIDHLAGGMVDLGGWLYHATTRCATDLDSHVCSGSLSCGVSARLYRKRRTVFARYAAGAILCGGCMRSSSAAPAARAESPVVDGASSGHLHGPGSIGWCHTDSRPRQDWVENAFSSIVRHLGGPRRSVFPATRCLSRDDTRGPAFHGGYC